MEPVTTRLKRLRESAKPKLAIRKMAEELGWPASSYAGYEDPAKFKKPILPLDKAEAIAAVLEQHGVDPQDVLALAGVTGSLNRLMDELSIQPEEWLEISGAVAAGVWKEQTNWPASERYDVKFGPSKFPLSQRFGVRMEGLSMNRTIQPGADLECLYVRYSPVPPMPGDLVIVERHAHDLVELTCKRLAMDGPNYVLLCESYEPEFQEPIPVGRPDSDNFSDQQINVVGIVLSAKLDLAPRDLSQRRQHSRY